MNIKEELIKIYDECIKELLGEFYEELDEDDKLDLDIAREELILGLDIDNLSEEDKNFIENNIALYRRYFSAFLNGDTRELKLVSLEMLKIKNQSK